MISHSKKPKSRRTPPPGRTLPNRVLRPFFHMACGPFDDKQYREISGGDKSLNLCMIYGFLYLGAVICFTLWTVFYFDIRWFLGGLLCLVLAVSLHRYLNRMEPTRFNTFDRETGLCCFTCGFWGNIKNEYPFAECEGRISRSARRTGASCHMLYLYHPQLGCEYLFESISGIDLCLGYWSFLVQYMDKNAPLPDVPQLEQYPNRTPGLGSWEDWKRKAKAPNFFDPFYQWEAELNRNPKLDIAYYWAHPEEAPWKQKEEGPAKTSETTGG